jgi:molybdopterin synthase sulfur carrier subunit
MAVEVKVAANLAKLVGDQRAVRAEGSTVRELLEDIESRYPGFKDMILTDGQIHRFVNIYLNDEDIRFLAKLDTPLKEGDVVSVLPALAGG